MSVENTTIQAELRETSSKGEIKKDRVNGLIPAVLYGKGKPTLISIARSNLPKKHTNSGLVNLVVNGSEKLAIMREVQVNPLNDQAIHFDFQEVAMNDKVRTHVPLNFVGLTREQEKEGAFNIRIRYLEVRCVLSKLPRAIDVDVSQLRADQSVQLFDLKLPKELYVKTGKGKNVALASIVKI